MEDNNQNKNINPIDTDDKSGTLIRNIALVIGSMLLIILGLWIFYKYKKT